jgi:hypothetical protein
MMKTGSDHTIQRCSLGGGSAKATMNVTRYRPSGITQSSGMGERSVER